MRFSVRSKVSILFSLVAAVTIIGGFAVAGMMHVSGTDAHAANTATSHAHINCANGQHLCTEVYDSDLVFGEGHYVGHDEPSTLFYSNVAGSGNRMQYNLTLPKDPSPTNPL